MIASAPSSLTRDVLDAECTILARHLIGCVPDDYVRAKYADGHDAMPHLAPSTAFDAALVGFARIGRVCAKIADAYASVLSPHASLRRKLVLLLAILETHPPFHRTIDSTPGASASVMLVRIIGRVATAGAALVAGALVFVPVRAVLALVGRRNT
jgi:hypothetical protein